jgi:hypothetical protein
MSEKLQPGIKETDFPTTPLLLEKTVRRNNILIGNDPVQIRFAEQFLSHHYHTKVTCQLLEICNDHHVLGKDEPLLYRVERSSLIDLSPHVRSKTGLWSLDLIENGSAGANAIVRHAASLAEIGKPSKEAMAFITKEITNDLFDINAAIWNAAYLLTGPIPPKVNWPRPWENYITWLPKGEDVPYRLNTLYWELVEYVFAAENDEKGWRKMGRAFRPKSFKFLSGLVLSKDRVSKSIQALSAWREHRTDPYVCALNIAKIWERQ